VKCEVALAAVAAVHRSFDIWYWGTGAWMAGLSVRELRLDVPTLTKETHYVLLMFGDVCWHIDSGVLEQQTADILDCPREGCSVLS
jgi:hypothetical protein